MPPHLLVSFVVPAHDEEQLLPATLRSIREAAEANALGFEIVVVDDASTDRTGSIAADLGARVVRVEHRRISKARNAGARAARGERLIFVDADTLVTAAAVRGAVAHMGLGAAGGGCAFRFDGRVPLHGRLLERAGNALYRKVGLASGCFLFCTRSAFEAVFGFDETLAIAEEAAFSRALARHGRFVVLAEAVTTSGRKLRCYSLWELLAAIASGLPWPGRSPDAGPALWYGPRRPDPERPRP